MSFGLLSPQSPADVTFDQIEEARATDNPATVSSRWTVFTPGNDTRIIYVSDSEGTDWATYEYHTVDDPEVGGDPFHPVGQVTAYRTLAAAYNRMRDGYPDWMLLKSGDSWNATLSPLGGWRKSGRAEDEPQLVAAYANGPRPVIQSGQSTGMTLDGGTDHLALVGLEFYPRLKDPDAPDFDPDSPDRYAIQALGPNDDILVEGCLATYYDTHMLFQVYSGPLSNIRVRRCVLTDAYSIHSHSQGIHTVNVRGLLLEENVFDHNGWHDWIPGAEPTQFNHNGYITGLTKSDDIVIRGNIFARGSSFAFKLRSDCPAGIDHALVQDNLLVANGDTISLGGAGGEAAYTHRDVIVRRNVVTEGGRTLDNGPHSFGVDFKTAQDCVAEDNFFIYKPHQSPSFAIRLLMDMQIGIVIQRNVVHQWWVNGQAIQAEHNPPDVIVQDNLVELDPDQYVDADRTVESYSASIGGDATLESFLTEARKQCRSYWRDECTGTPIVQYIAEGFTLASACDCDINHDCVVNIEDVFCVLGAWGSCNGCPEDVNCDGSVNIDDLFEVLAHWGPCP